MMDKKKNKGGRPSKYNVKIALEICERIASGESLRRICRDSEMPHISTVMLWVLTHKQFSEQYAKAREIQAEILFEELLEISDDGSNDWMERETKDGNIVESVNHEHIARSRLRVDTRKWYLSKVLPKKYGDKLEHEHSGEVHLSVSEFLKDAHRNKERFASN